MNPSQKIPHGLYRLLIHDLKGQLGNLQGLWTLTKEDSSEISYEDLSQWVFKNFLELIESLSDLIALEKGQDITEPQTCQIKNFLDSLKQELLKHPEWEGFAIETLSKDLSIELDSKRFLRSLKHILQAFKKRLHAPKKLFIEAKDSQLSFNFSKASSETTESLKRIKQNSSQWSEKEAREWGEILGPLIILEKLKLKVSWEEKENSFSFYLGWQT